MLAPVEWGLEWCSDSLGMGKGAAPEEDWYGPEPETPVGELLPGAVTVTVTATVEMTV